MNVLSIKDDFSEFPGLRNCNISESSGEEFYHEVLNKRFVEAYQKQQKLTVDLDRTAGFASSFLDEAFGNLVYDFSLEVVKKYIEIVSIQEPHWKEMIESRTFLEWEGRRKSGKRPSVTELHKAWYRLDKNELKSDVWEKPAEA